MSCLLLSRHTQKRLDKMTQPIVAQCFPHLGVDMVKAVNLDF